MTDVSPSQRFTPQVMLDWVPEPYLIAVGKVITQWSVMEAVLDAAIWQASRIRNDLGRSITSQMQVLNKLQLLETLLSQEYPLLCDQFHEVHEYVKHCLQGKRNIVAHGFWVVHPKRRHLANIIKFSARGKLVSQGGLTSVEEIEALAFKIAEVSCWLLEFVDLLPELQQRSGGLGHKTPETQNLRDCAIRRMRALQPPTAHPREPSPENPQKAKAQPKRPKRSQPPQSA